MFFHGPRLHLCGPYYTALSYCMMIANDYILQTSSLERKSALCMLQMVEEYAYLKNLVMHQNRVFG